MPAPNLRTRSLRKVFKKVPGGRISLHRVRRKPNAAKCGCCGIALKGVPRELIHKMRHLPKTMKRPQRPYGGVLCSGCMRQEIIKKIRQ